MFEPKQTEIDEKVQELLAQGLADDDMLVHAVINCLPKLRALLAADFSQHSDAKLDLETSIKSFVVSYMNLIPLATDVLIAECGHTVRTDVDDFKFVTHDDRG